MPRHWRRRMATDCLDYLYSYRTQAVFNTARQPVDERRYRLHRQLSSAMFICSDLSESINRAPVEPGLMTHPDVRICREAGNNVVAWVNDLFSAPKELALRERCNYVCVLQRHDGLSLPAAAEATARHVEGEVARFFAAEERLNQQVVPRLPLAERQALRMLLTGLKTWMAGHHAWATESTRYHERRVTT
jgi:hypothetical protein